MKHRLKGIFLILPILFIGYVLPAQSPFTFDHIEHDFGDIQESGGVAKAKFYFTNSGTEPLFISEVNVSCGCTEPVYTKDTIAPGEKSFVEARYDPARRPGSFDKALFVTFNNKPGFRQTLRIRGNVISVNLPSKGKYPILYGNVSVSSNVLDFGNMEKDQTYTQKFKISNDGFNNIQFMSATQLPKEFKIDFPRNLNAGDSSEITVSVNKSDLENIWGEFTYKFQMTTSDYGMPVKIFYVKGKTVQDFSNLSKKELKEAPVIKVESTSLKFGNIKKGGTSTQTIYVTNKGKTNLEIRKVHNPCYCLRGEIDKNIIAPGEKAQLTLTFDSIGLSKGKKSRGVNIYSNDPKSSEITVYGEATIED